MRKERTTQQRRKVLQGQGFFLISLRGINHKEGWLGTLVSLTPRSRTVDSSCTEMSWWEVGGGVNECATSDKVVP